MCSRSVRPSLATSPATQLGGIAWKPVVSDDGRPLEPIGAWPTVRRDLDHRLVDVQWTV